MAAEPILVAQDFTNIPLLNVRLEQLGADPTGLESKLYYNSGTKTVRFFNGTVWIDLGKLNQISPPDASVSFNSQRGVNFADPINPQDAATKNYVDAAITGLDFKQSARLKTIGNVNLAAPGTTFDGVAAAAGNRILLTDQTDQTQNGIYVWTASGSALSRASDADTTGELNPGTFVFIEEGTQYNDSGWVMTSDGPFTLGTSNQIWVQFTGTGQIGAGQGLTKTGNTLDIVAADGSITVSADSISVGLVPVTKGGTGSTTASGARTNLSAAGTYEQLIGDGSAVVFTVTHGLGTTGVDAVVTRVSDGVKVRTGVRSTDANNVQISFDIAAPASNSYRVKVTS